MFPLDEHVKTLLSVTPLTAPPTDVRNSQPLTNPEQDSVSKLIASLVFKRKMKEPFSPNSSHYFLSVFVSSE